MVVRINSDFVPLVQDLHECSNLRVLTLSGDLAPGYMHKGMKGTRSVTEVILGPDRLLQGERDRWMKDVVTAVKKVCVCMCMCLCVCVCPVSVVRGYGKRDALENTADM